MTGFEPYVPDYFVGGCSVFGEGGSVPAEGSPLHGLTVLASGLTGMKALEVDASNAYLAGASTISRLPVAGGTPEIMVAGAMPLATALDASNLYWIDGSVSGQTRVLSVPLTATGWGAFPGDAGASQTATMLASATGNPGAFTLAGGYLYFGAGTVVSRVPVGGGATQTVYSGIAPTGIAVGGDTVYLGDDPNWAIQFVMLSGQFAGLLQGLSGSNFTPTQLALSGGTLYWGDWGGSIEHIMVATPTMGRGIEYTPCGGGACRLNLLRSTANGAVWESGESGCSNLGTVNADSSTYFAVSVSKAGGIAVAGNYFYAVTRVGQLLRFDL
jgi:hypothetical protein